MTTEYTLRAFKNDYHERWGVIPKERNLYIGYSPDLDDMIRRANTYAEQNGGWVIVVDRMGETLYTTKKVVKQ